MTTTFDERINTITKNLPRKQRTTAVILDFSNVPNMDFTAVKTLQEIVSKSRPKVRMVPGSDGKIIKTRCFGTLFYLVSVPKRVHSVLDRSGLYRLVVPSSKLTCWNGRGV